MATVGEGAAPQRSEITKAGIASLAASSIEWYDFFIYLTAAALVFPAVFFPESSAVAGVLASFSTAAVGFVARPVGGVLFGHFGDKLGRKPTLVIALVLMGTATVLVGLLPGFATLGVLAPMVLFILRFCQGLAIGGQWGGAVLLATEYAPPDRRGLFGSLAQTGVPVGVILGNLVFLAVAAVTTDAQFVAWGWRIPFLVGVLLIGVAMYIQLRLEETPAFKKLEEQQEGGESQERSPVLEVIKEHPKQILLAGGAFFVVNGSFYILISGILDYGTRSLGLSSDAMLAAVLISSAFQIPALIGFAALTDRVGRRPVYLIGAVLLGLWAFPMFWLVDTRNIVLITVALTLGQVFLSMMYGPQAALYAEMFSARVRYSGASLGYQGASVFAGGLAPIIMVWLLETTGTSLSVSFYILAMAAVTFLSVYLITHTYEDEMARDVAQDSETIAGKRGASTS
jgi:MFS transporter, MHS family, shikimate and dehydroshikimate transport protein